MQRECAARHRVHRCLLSAGGLRLAGDRPDPRRAGSGRLPSESPPPVTRVPAHDGPAPARTARRLRPAAPSALRPQVFEAVIPRTVDFSESIATRMTIDQWKPRSVAERSVTALAAEIERRLEQHHLDRAAGV